VRLHHHAAIETLAFENGLEFARQVVPPQRGWLRGHPGIGQTAYIPKMLMRVDSHTFIILKRPLERTLAG
jgi:hypothetical protein